MGVGVLFVFRRQRVRYGLYARFSLVHRNENKEANFFLPPDTVVESLILRGLKAAGACNLFLWALKLFADTKRIVS